MGQGLKLIKFYVLKLIAALEIRHNQPPVRNKPLGAIACVKRVYWPWDACLPATYILEYITFIAYFDISTTEKLTNGDLVTLNPVLPKLPNSTQSLTSG